MEFVDIFYKFRYKKMFNSNVEQSRVRTTSTTDCVIIKSTWDFRVV